MNGGIFGEQDLLTVSLVELLSYRVFWVGRIFLLFSNFSHIVVHLLLPSLYEFPIQFIPHMHFVRCIYINKINSCANRIKLLYLCVSLQFETRWFSLSPWIIHASVQTIMLKRKFENCSYHPLENSQQCEWAIIYWFWRHVLIEASTRWHKNLDDCVGCEIVDYILMRKFDILKSKAFAFRGENEVYNHTSQSNNFRMCVVCFTC